MESPPNLSTETAVPPVPQTPFQPEVQPLGRGVSVREALRRLAGLPHCLMLESSLIREGLGRYSFLMADPVTRVQVDGDVNSALAQIQARLEREATPICPGLPPFQGGWAGLLSYELGTCFEALPIVEPGPVQLPKLSFGLYDCVLAWDHARGEAWLISQGLSGDDSTSRAEKRAERARERLAHFLSILDGPSPETATSATPPRRLPVPANFKAVCDGVWSNFTKGEYLTAVESAIEYIRAGDIFQTNLSQQLLVAADRSALALYESLVERNASPFAAYLDLGHAQVISSSPERLLQVADGRVETRPIKGTRLRTGVPECDLLVQQELATNDKERAENTMIVDLMRNDLSRICTDESVEVTQWCGLESYGSVFHLVSAVCGSLRPDVDWKTILSSVFPGGSVTGAPKIRAMEIISELEQIPRGAYCGSLGYIGLDGQADFNILIRTITAQHGWWQIPVGGAVVAQSDPEAEYAETWTKANAMLQACLRDCPVAGPKASRQVAALEPVSLQQERAT